MTQNTRAFTLIEVLVVVLIIGILAAVALPQYQKSVIKSRIATILPVLSNIVQAEEVFYLANGEYTSNALLLDIELPAECKLSNMSDNEGMYWSCGTDFLLWTFLNGVNARYCPNANLNIDTCLEKSVVEIGFANSHSKMLRSPANTRRCWVPTGTTAGREDICKLLGAPVICNDKTCYELY